MAVLCELMALAWSRDRWMKNSLSIDKYHLWHYLIQFDMITTELWLLEWAMTALMDHTVWLGVADWEEKLSLFHLGLLQFSLDLLQICSKLNLALIHIHDLFYYHLTHQLIHIIDMFNTLFNTLLFYYHSIHNSIHINYCISNILIHHLILIYFSFIML